MGKSAVTTKTEQNWVIVSQDENTVVFKPQFADGTDNFNLAKYFRNKDVREHNPARWDGTTKTYTVKTGEKWERCMEVLSWDKAEMTKQLKAAKEGTQEPVTVVKTAGKQTKTTAEKPAKSEGVPAGEFIKRVEALEKENADLRERLSAVEKMLIKLATK